ncbi:UNVERIFIED_CONTAM: tRNA (cytidine/uridine-2'-O-)-methyltransferase [Acetivibrio alkalicellulosi]
MEIVLVEPEIPQNAGNIARTCAATGAGLHMIKPLGFSVEDKYLKRAGLDYWNQVNVNYYDSLEELFLKYNKSVFYYATTKALNTYADVRYPEDCFIVFGKETAGLPEELLSKNKDYCIRIPMKEHSRSLNLSNSAAIIIYEALRQNNFKSLMWKGRLTKYSW